MTEKEIREAAKRELDKPRQAKVAAAVAEEGAEQMWESVKSLKAFTFDDIKVRGGNAARTVERAVEALERRLDLLANATVKEWKEKEKTQGLINRLPDQEHRTVLTYKFVLLLDWDEIPDRMGYSERQTYRIYADALLAYGTQVLSMELDETCQ